MTSVIGLLVRAVRRPPNFNQGLAHKAKHGSQFEMCYSKGAAETGPVRPSGDSGFGAHRRARTVGLKAEGPKTRRGRLAKSAGTR